MYETLKPSIIKLKIKIKSVAYSSQVSHTGQLDNSQLLAMTVRRGNMISSTLGQV